MLPCGGAGVGASAAVLFGGRGSGVSASVCGLVFVGVRVRVRGGGCVCGWRYIYMRVRLLSLSSPITPDTTTHTHSYSYIPAPTTASRASWPSSPNSTPPPHRPRGVRGGTADNPPHSRGGGGRGMSLRPSPPWPYRSCRVRCWGRCPWGCLIGTRGRVCGL